jgi:hypothetical protein
MLGTFCLFLLSEPRLELRLLYQLLRLTADPFPSAQLHVQEIRIQISVYPKRKYIMFNKATNGYNEEVPVTSGVLLILCSYSCQVLDLCTSCCTNPMILKTNLTAM